MLLKGEAVPLVGGQDVYAVATQMFSALLAPFIQLLNTVSDAKTLQQLWQQTMDSALLERLLVMISDLADTEHRKPQIFAKTASFWKEVQQKELKDKEKSRAAASSGKHWAKGTGRAVITCHSALK